MVDVISQAYIRFELRAVEDRAATIKNDGRYTAKDVEFIVIVPPGDGKTVLEQKVNDRHKHRYKKEYEAWKAGREVPIEGTSIRDWKAASPAITENLLRANIRTVEQLAACNESTLERIGMGARNLQNKAKAYLEASTGPDKMAQAMTELNRRMDEMDSANSEKDQIIADQQAELEAFRKMQPQAGSAMLGGDLEGDREETNPPIPPKGVGEASKARGLKTSKRKPGRKAGA